MLNPYGPAAIPARISPAIGGIRSRPEQHGTEQDYHKNREKYGYRMGEREHGGLILFTVDNIDGVSCRTGTDGRQIRRSPAPRRREMEGLRLSCRGYREYRRFRCVLLSWVRAQAGASVSSRIRPTPMDGSASRSNGAFLKVTTPLMPNQGHTPRGCAARRLPNR